MAGLLGLPFPNGLIPQAPFHTESLCVTKAIDSDSDETDGKLADGDVFRATHVVEQRVSNLAQGLLTVVAMTGPLLVVLHLIPQGVLAGLFFIMGFQALQGNGITLKLLFLLRDAKLTPANHPLKTIRRGAVWLFVAIELVGFGATFAITQTVAAVGFPVFIFLLIPARALLLPKWIEPEALAVLDEPTASPFTMDGIGGTYGGRDAGNGSGVLDAPEEGGRLSRSDAEIEDESNGRKGKMASGSDRTGGKSDEELAELGESRSGVVRRSAAGRGDEIARV